MELLGMFFLGLAAATTVSGVQSLVPICAAWVCLDRFERIFHTSFVTIWLGSALAAAWCLL